MVEVNEIPSFPQRELKGEFASKAEEEIENTEFCYHQKTYSILFYFFMMSYERDKTHDSR